AGGLDARARLWRAGAGGEVGTLGGHVGGVAALAFVRSGKALVTADGSGVLRLWDLEDDKRPCLRTVNEHGGKEVTALAYSPASKRLASAGLDGRVVWRPADDWERKREMKLPFAVHALAFAPD